MGLSRSKNQRLDAVCTEPARRLQASLAVHHQISWVPAKVKAAEQTRSISGRFKQQMTKLWGMPLAKRKAESCASENRAGVPQVATAQNATRDGVYNNELWRSIWYRVRKSTMCDVRCNLRWQYTWCHQQFAMAIYMVSPPLNRQSAARSRADFKYILFVRALALLVPNDTACGTAHSSVGARSASPV